MKIRTAYPIKVGKTLFPADTEVETVPYDHPLLLEWFPGLRENRDSVQAAVEFPGIGHPTIVHIRQLRVPQPRPTAHDGPEPPPFFRDPDREPHLVDGLVTAE